MSDSDGCGVAIGVIVLLVVAYFVIIYVILPFVALVASVGVVWGGGHSVVNYFKALNSNVALEKP